MKIADGYWAGLEVTLASTDNVPLQYPSEDPPQNHRVSKYVECKNGQRFQLNFKRSDSFKHAIRIGILLDGRQVDCFVMMQKSSCKTADYYVEENADGKKVRMAFAFGAEPSEDGPRLDPTKVDLDQLGTISVTFESGTASRMYTFSSKGSAQRATVGGAKAKKLLSSFVVGEEIGPAKPRPYCSWTPELGAPILTACFIYRTDEVLRTIGIKPPLPATEEAKPRIEGCKRKAAKLEGPKKKHKTETIDLTSMPSPVVTPPSPDDEPEVIDLTQ